MIDERHEELAALHALDLLEGAERAAFERELAASFELAALVDELRESSVALAHGAPAAEPPAELKSRVMASVGKIKDENQKAKIISFPSLLPWAAAACFALLASWFAQLYFTTQSENQLAAAQNALADLALKSANNQLEAERILARAQASNSTRQAADSTRQLADLNSRLSSTDQLLTRARSELETERATTTQRLADLDRQLSGERAKSSGTAVELTEARRLLAARDTQLREQVQLVAALEARARQDSDLANFKIATLASMLKNSPQARAVAVWNPAKQEGIFTIEKSPALAADQILELWTVEAKEGAKPVSAGVFAIGADGTARVQFKPTVPVSAIAAFAVSREKNDGTRAHAAPTEVVMMGKSL